MQAFGRLGGDDLPWNLPFLHLHKHLLSKLGTCCSLTRASKAMHECTQPQKQDWLSQTHAAVVQILKLWSTTAVPEDLPNARALKRAVMLIRALDACCVSALPSASFSECGSSGLSLLEPLKALFMASTESEPKKRCNNHAAPEQAY